MTISKTTFQRYSILLTLAAISAAYLLTFARYPLNYADSLELVTASYLGGVAHPPGYPLYTAILYLLTHLPLPFSPAQIANFSSVIIQLAAYGIYYLAIKQLLRIILPKLTLISTLTIQAVLLCFAFTYHLWYYSLFAEVFALNHLFISIFLYTVFRWQFLAEQQHAQITKWLIISILTAGLAFSHHQTIAFLYPGWLYLLYAHYSRSENIFSLKNIRSFFSRNYSSITILIGLSLLIFLLPFSIIFIQDSNQAQFSWQFQPTAQGLYQLITRQIYSDTGSAIETYAAELDLNHSYYSAIHYLKLLLSDITLIPFLFALYGIYYLAKHSKKMAAFTIITLLVSGPLLAAYLKFPYYEQISDAGYYAGTALRWRMFLLHQFILILPATVAAVALQNLIKQNLHKIIFTSFILATAIILIVQNYAQVDLSQANFDYQYYQKILQDLPQDSVLVINSDAAFGLLYLQLVEQNRSDLKLIPVTYEMRANTYHSANLVSYYPYQDRDLRLSDIVSTHLHQQQRVFILDPDPSQLLTLGVEGNPFYAIPSGYTLEISTHPPQSIPDYDYALTLQLQGIQFAPQNFWGHSHQGSIAITHTLHGYYFTIGGYPDLGLKHFLFAKKLARQSFNKALIEQSQQFANRSINQYLAAAPPNLQDLTNLAQSAYQKQNYPIALTYLHRASFYSPLNTTIKQNLLDWYQILGKSEEVARQSRHLNMCITYNQQF